MLNLHVKNCISSFAQRRCVSLIGTQDSLHSHSAMWLVIFVHLEITHSLFSISQWFGLKSGKNFSWPRFPLVGHSSTRGWGESHFVSLNSRKYPTQAFSVSTSVYKLILSNWNLNAGFRSSFKCMVSFPGVLRRGSAFPTRAPCVFIYSAFTYEAALGPDLRAWWGRGKPCALLLVSPLNEAGSKTRPEPMGGWGGGWCHWMPGNLSLCVSVSVYIWPALTLTSS